MLKWWSSFVHFVVVVFVVVVANISEKSWCKKIRSIIFGDFLWTDKSSISHVLPRILTIFLSYFLSLSFFLSIYLWHSSFILSFFHSYRNASVRNPCINFQRNVIPFVGESNGTSLSLSTCFEMWKNWLICHSAVTSSHSFCKRLVKRL